MDAITLLTNDHREVEKLFAGFERQGQADKRLVADKICSALKTHATLEEEIFYPAGRAVLDSADEDLIDEGIHEHAEAKDLIAQIEEADDEELDELVEELKLAIEHHVGEEEGELFPALLEANLETKQLGERMEKRKLELASQVK